MAYKDEYEVARLYTDGRFLAELEKSFAGKEKLKLHLAPPLLGRRDAETGVPVKRAFGAWILPVLRLLARLKDLRGSGFDIFGSGAERETARRLVKEYEQTIDELVRGLGHENHQLAVEIASIPEMVRGFGHVKARNLVAAEAKLAELRTRWEQQLPETRNAA